MYNISVMSIIDKIKRFWKKQNIKALPEGNKELNKKGMFKKNWINSGGNNGKETKADKYIELFLNSYLNQLKVNEANDKTSCFEMAYTALVTMTGKQVTKDQYFINQKNEDELLSQDSIKSRYTIERQKLSETGETIFYHIKSIGYTFPEYKDIVRVYLNCSNENIAKLSQVILNFNTNSNFYMKFASNKVNARNPRGEKIVIYCKENELEKIVSTIEYINKVRPDLFEESEKKLPFFQTKGSLVSVSRQPETNEYISLNGGRRKIPQSTNAFLTNILRESYIEAVREISRSDEKISFLLENNNLGNEKLYMQNFPYINYNYHNYLIQSMKAKMGVLAQKNNIYMEEIYEPKIETRTVNEESRGI